MVIQAGVKPKPDCEIQPCTPQRPLPIVMVSHPCFSAFTAESNDTSCLVGEFLGGFFAVGGYRVLASMLVSFDTSRGKWDKRCRAQKESQDEPCELLAQASNAIGDLLVDTPTLLRVDFALAKLLFNRVETWEENSSVTLHGLSD